MTESKVVGRPNPIGYFSACNLEVGTMFCTEKHPLDVWIRLSNGCARIHVGHGLSVPRFQTVGECSLNGSRGPLSDELDKSMPLPMNTEVILTAR